jgi:P-type E1-E2 ATPase
VLEDRVRPDAAALIAALRAAGVRKVVLASGDRRAVAGAVGKDLGVDELLAEMTPADKIAAVRREAKFGRTMMVGDGINDAPALAAADVGVAMGARGATAPSQSAGIVVLVDELAPLVRAMAIAKRTLAIAQQSVWAGLGLSLVAMVAAALGYLPPVQGALIQEAIDVAVILNALRALR